MQRTKPTKLWKNTKKFINNLDQNKPFEIEDICNFLFKKYKDKCTYFWRIRFYLNILCHVEFLTYNYPEYRKIKDIPLKLSIKKVRNYLKQKHFYDWFLINKDEYFTN